MLGSRGDSAEPQSSAPQRDSGAPVIDFDDEPIPFQGLTQGNCARATNYNEDLNNGT